MLSNRVISSQLVANQAIDIVSSRSIKMGRKTLGGIEHVLIDIIPTVEIMPRNNR